MEDDISLHDFSAIFDEPEAVVPVEPPTVPSRPPPAEVYPPLPKEPYPLDPTLIAWQTKGQRVILNVQGQKFMTTRATLKSQDGILKNLMHLEPCSHEAGVPVYFVDRDPSHFRLILNHLRNILHPVPPCQEKIDIPGIHFLWTF